jgi:hypothetical protein
MKNDNEKILYIVHCVDTEGPLYESLTATSERIEKTFGLKYNLTPEQLERLRMGLDIPHHLKDSVMDFVSVTRLNYNRDWHEVNEMLDEIMSSKWRMRYQDDFGNGYLFNWFILDHVGYKTNPRRRSLGYHVIFEHYKEKIKSHHSDHDKIYWHFHPVSFSYEAHKTSNNFSFTNYHLEVLSRRIIDHLYFPNSFRPGCHVIRADINLFLEMWIPFDYANQGMEERCEDKLQQDIAAGRYGDWRRATDKWEVYHPDFYDYQKKGNMRRYIARCLNIGCRYRSITDEEIEKAFIASKNGKRAILSVTDHDEREMRIAIDEFYTSVKKIQKKYPDVKICNSNAADAVRHHCQLKKEDPTKLFFSWHGNTLKISADKSIWGPQPYFCFKTKDFRYIHENLDNQNELIWSYVFDENTIGLDQLESIGIATNDKYGNTSIYKLSANKDLELTQEAFLNDLQK